MHYISIVLCFLSVLPACLKCEGHTNKYDTNVQDKHRSSRKYDVPYVYPGKYGDDRDEAEEEDNDDSSSGTRVAVAPEDDKTPSYSNLKGFSFSPPVYSSSFKGYPFKTYWKGKGDDVQPMNPVKMMEMMMMMKAMQMDLQDPTKDEGFLSKFITDAKSFLMAAIVPLSIILAAIVPVMINHMMTGASSPIIQTTASNKESRSLVDANILEDILQKFEEISRNTESDECAEKTLCKVVYSDSSILKDHIRKVASTVAKLVKDEWIKDFKIKSFVHGLTGGNCDSVCKKFVSTPRNRD